MAALATVGVLLTGSRAGLVLLLAGLAGSAAMAVELRALPHRVKLMAAGLALAVLLAVVLVLVLVLAQPGGALGEVFQRSFTANDQRYSFWSAVAPMPGKYWP